VPLLSSSFRDARRITIVLVFAVHGITVGSLFSRIAEIQAAIGLGEAEFGLALVGLPTGVFTGSLFVSRLIERRGTRAVLLFAYPCFTTVLVLVSLAFSTLSLFACLLLFGLALTSCNITMNVEADRVEAATGGRLINRCHGTWGVGFLLATLGGTGAVAAGIAPTVHFLIVLAVIALCTMVIVAPMQPSPPRQHRGSAKPPRFAVPTLGVLLIMGFACSGIVLEGTSRNWSIIYLRDDFAAEAWVATLTLPSIVIAQTAGRFLADGLIDRFGPVRVAAALSGVSFAGLVAITSVSSVFAALVGFALIGLGISTVHPQMLSAAARLGDRPSSLNVASLSTMQTLIGFLSPPIFGFIAARYGIRTSFAIILPLPLVAIGFARALAPKD
jgi:MFS family permease